MKHTPKLDDSEVYRLADAGHSQREIADRLGVSHVAIGNRLRTRGKAEPTPAPPEATALVDRLVAFARLLDDVDTESASLVREAIKQLCQAADALDGPDDETDDGVPLDALEIVRRSIRRDERSRDLAFAVGNAAAASRLGRSVVLALPTLARLERASKEGDGMIHISRADLDAANARVDDLIRKTLDRPLQCQTCSRELSVAWAEDRAPDYSNPA